MTNEDMKLYEKYDKELKQIKKIIKENDKQYKKILEEIKDGKRKKYN
jgi:hypothetical protein